MRLLDLLYMAYFGVDDAACNAVALHVAGSLEAFVNLMNTAALEFGCADTRFANTHGKADPEQYTTARDLAVIMDKASRYPLFAQIAGVFDTTLPETNFSERRNISSPNQILNTSSKYYYRYASAARTSATYESGYGIVASAARDDVSLIVVVLGAAAVILEDESTQMQNITEGRRLFEWGFDNFAWRSVLSSGELVAQTPVKYGDGVDNVVLRPSDSINMLLDGGVDESDFTREIVIYADQDDEVLTAPIKKDAVLGEITVYLYGEKCGSAYLVANTGVELRRVKYIEDQIAAALGNRWVKFSLFIVAVLFLLYIALVIRYNRLRRSRLRRIKEAKQRLIDERMNAQARDATDRGIGK
jgi:D-alanyl-D-alanine carboxypeptidase (penicillin-binding protein 5/6)